MTAVAGLVRRATADAAVSWPAFWVTLVASLALYLSSTLDEITRTDLPLRIAIVTAAAVGMFAAMAGLRRVPYVAARGDDARWTLALIVCGAIVRGLVVGGASAVLLHTPAQVPYRIAASVMALVPLVIVTAAVVADVRTQAERRAALAAARRRVQEAERAADEELIEAHAATVARVREVARAGHRRSRPAGRGRAAPPADRRRHPAPQPPARDVGPAVDDRYTGRPTPRPLA